MCFVFTQLQKNVWALKTQFPTRKLEKTVRHSRISGELNPLLKERWPVIKTLVKDQYFDLVKDQLQGFYIFPVRKTRWDAKIFGACGGPMRHHVKEHTPIIRMT